MFFNLLLCVIGFIFLSYAADKLVEGASNMALNFGVSKTVIGLTVVAAGTSLPEMVVSVNASLKGNPALSLGNLVGSNIMNAGLILGIAAVIFPITCGREIVRREVPIMIGTALVLWYMAHTGSEITPTEGLILFAMLFAYTGLSYYWSRQESKIAREIAATTDMVTGEDADSGNIPSPRTNILYILGGMVGLVIGSETLVKGAVAIATTMGVSNEVIGLTLIAIGTSLPELATSVVAARKGHSEITLGNVVGSNIFNVLGIVGCASAVSFFNAVPEARVLPVSPEMLGLHIPLMVVISLGVLPIMSTGMKIIRAEGFLLIGVYLAYNVMLLHTTAPQLSPVAHPAPITAPAEPQKMAPPQKTEPAQPTENQQDKSSTEAIETTEATEATEAIESESTENETGVRKTYEKTDPQTPDMIQIPEHNPEILDALPEN